MKIIIENDDELKYLDGLLHILECAWCYIKYPWRAWLLNARQEYEQKKGY